MLTSLFGRITGVFSASASEDDPLDEEVECLRVCYPEESIYEGEFD